MGEKIHSLGSASFELLKALMGKESQTLFILSVS